MDRIAISSQWSKALHAALQTSCDDNMHVTQLVRASAVYCETSLEYLNGLNCSPGGVSRAGEYLVIIQETAAGQITWRQTEGSRWDEDSCVLPTHTVYFLSPTVSSSTCFTLAVLPNATLKGLMSPPEIKLGRCEPLHCRKALMAPVSQDMQDLQLQYRSQIGFKCLIWKQNK